jgi:CRP-like cAMP-binding protein
MRQNRLLAALPRRDFERLKPQLQWVELEHGQVLADHNERIRHVWFPVSSVVSQLSTVEDGSSVETASIGREGVVGLPALLGAAKSPNRAVVQLPGAALRIGAPVLTNAMWQSQPLAEPLLCYVHALMHQISQVIACNTFHDVQQRLCRWLLAMHDRVGERGFPLTQEFMADTLGVRRPTISVAAQNLQEIGAIRYRRGTMEILDRERLEKCSCECYWIVRDEFDRLFAP